MKNTISPEMFYGVPYAVEPTIASTTVFANADNSAQTGNAMTQYRTQQQNNSNWLFGNPAAAEFNDFIATNKSFEQSFVQGVQGAGRTLQNGLADAQRWATENQNWLYGGVAVVAGLALMKAFSGGKRRR